MADVQWRYHPVRDALLAEAHARPYSPLASPMMATRIGTLSGQDGAALDREHLTRLCRRLGQPEPSPTARWSTVDAGAWKLRWERHTEFSTWTFFRPSTRSHPFLETAIDLAPADWVAALPGDVLVAVKLELRPREGAPSPAGLLGADAIGAQLMDGAASVFTDLRADGSGMTRYLLLESASDPSLSGRAALRLLEIETYRLMALLAFPLAGETSARLSKIETEAGEIATQLADDETDPDEDRRLLARLISLAAEAEAASVRTSFRFAAGRAYHEIVHDRIAALRETPIQGLQTLSEFMERRLAPAMRTCDTVAERERAAIERIARTERMLNTRVEVAAEASSAALLHSMDRRARMQLQLQRTVEGLSVAAISYYALGLFFYVAQAAARLTPAIDPIVATGLAAPAVIGGVWYALRQVRARLGTDL
jgi:uncharacterized membrane-anchored protein